MLKQFLEPDSIRLNYSKEPELSVSLTGCTILKSTTLKSRFSGSKRYIVDRSGCLQKKEAKQKISYKKKSQPQKKFYSINKSRIKHIIQNYINAQPGKKQLYFFTITFPPCVKINLAYRLLNSWLTTARTSQNLKHYLWITELQANGTPHFHLCSGEYLHIGLANTAMKNLLHYAIRHHGLQWLHTSARKYNGVDIAKNRITKKVINFATKNSGKTLGGYLTKYISKSNEKFTHQAWQNSRSLSGLFTKYNMCRCEFPRVFSQKLFTEKPLFDNDFYSFYKWKKEPPPEIVFLLSLVNKQVLGRVALS